MKTGLLEVRPVFVRKERRTRGHVFVTMLAYRLARTMEARLRQAGIDLPLSDALTLLNGLCLYGSNLDGVTLWSLPQPTAQQQRLLAALGVTLPKRLLTSRR